MRKKKYNELKIFYKKIQIWNTAAKDVIILIHDRFVTFAKNLKIEPEWRQWLTCNYVLGPRVQVAAFLGQKSRRNKIHPGRKPLHETKCNCNVNNFYIFLKTMYLPCQHWPRVTLKSTCSFQTSSAGFCRSSPIFCAAPALIKKCFIKAVISVMGHHTLIRLRLHIHEYITLHWFIRGQ